MPINDPFSYYGRFDSMDLDCSYCSHFKGPDNWPDVNKVSKCNFHGISLDFQLGQNCYKAGEWFCKHYQNKVEDSPHKALTELNSIRNQLQERVIYSGRNGEYLFERNI
jgi:hypothetical protein